MLLNGGFNWQIYLPGVDGARAKVLYKEEGQELLIEVYITLKFFTTHARLTIRTHVKMVPLEVPLVFLLLVVAGCKDVVAALPHSHVAASCVIDSDNYCRAVCGDVVLDISKVFTYPWVSLHQPIPVIVHHKTFDRVKTSTRNYDYVYSPCNNEKTYCTAVGEPETAV